jgi:hypothetical protein
MIPQLGEYVTRIGDEKIYGCPPKTPRMSKRELGESADRELESNKVGTPENDAMSKCPPESILTKLSGASSVRNEHIVAVAA